MSERKPKTVRVPLSYEAERMLADLIAYGIRERLICPGQKDKAGIVIRTAISRLHAVLVRDNSLQGEGAERSVS